MDTDPPQVNAVVRGNLTESCATLGQSDVQYDSGTFHITVYAVSPGDIGCAQVTTPFETTVALDTHGLPAGTYTVIANGVSAVFSIQTGKPQPTAAPTTAPTRVPTAVPSSHGCTDAAAFVADMSVPDDSLLQPGQAFVKIWRLKNVGTCTWTSGYLVSYITGTTMSQQPAYWAMGSKDRIVPGQMLDVRVNMQAPMQNGTYQSYWGLKGLDGRLMPISGGANGNSFFVKIKVSDIPSGMITDMRVEIEPEQGSGAACTPNSTYLVHAYITSNGPLSVGYQLMSSAGQISAGYFMSGYTDPALNVVNGTVDFEPSMFTDGGAHTLRLDYRFVGPYPYPDNIMIVLRLQDDERTSATVACP